MGTKSDKFAGLINVTPRAEASAKSITLGNLIEGERPEYQYIKISNIEFNTLNDYSESDSESSIRELAEDIRRNGLLHNIVLSYTPDGRYKLLSGERRVRAFHLLFEETKDVKYDSIYSLVRKGLTEIEEMIIIDAANLQVRGGIGDEKKYRKATVRFINNLKKQYSISDEEAINFTKNHSSVTEGVIEKNIVLENDLNPELLAYLDSGVISKIQAYEYARLKPEIQKLIAENLKTAETKGGEAVKKMSDEIIGHAKEIRRLDDTLSEQKRNLKEIKAEEKAVNKILKSTDEEAEEAEEALARKEQVERNREITEEAIKDTQKQIARETKEIKNTQASPEEDEELLQSIITQEVNKALKSLRTSTRKFLDVCIFDKISRLSKRDRERVEGEMQEMITLMKGKLELFKDER